MKELSIEEKAKAYDKAITYAKNLLNTIGNATLGNLVLKNEFENMFPQLKENEDEKLREQVVYAINQLHVCECTKNKLKSWLEKQCEQKPAWSEEDDQYLLVCKNALAKYQASDKWDSAIISHWLENKLKAPQNTWKPSDEQMKALSNAGNSFRPFEEGHKLLWSLYNDLKKLREG